MVMMVEEVGMYGDEMHYFGGIPEGANGGVQFRLGDELSDDDMDIEELERRMWRDRMRLKRLKEQNK
ncbi:hypothetical protein KSS87_012092, partial [Heliosperma pusillum]